MSAIVTGVIDWLARYQINLLLTAVAIGIFFLLRRVVIPRLEAYVERDHLKKQTFHSALFTFSLLAAIVTLVVVMLIWGINVRELLAVSTGIIAVTGVALFATWSILSNITAFFILLSHPSFKQGNYIRVIELDNYIEGYIRDINIFNTILVTDSQEKIVYPNNLLTARPIIINPKEHYRTIGKTEDFRRETSPTERMAKERD